MNGASRDEALAALELRGTAQMEEFPESPLTGASLPTGWYLIVDQRREYSVPFMRAKTLRRISETREVVACFVEEHVMCSQACFWRNGEEIWLIDHDASGGLLHLKTKGILPESFASVRDRLFAEQRAAGEGVDYVFDVPVEVARELTGYRYDDDIPTVSGKAFEVLESIAPTPKRSWVRRFFGG